MKINKDTVVQGFIILEKVYADFSRKIENKEQTREMIDTWVTLLETANINYQEANKDFITAIEKLSTTSKYVPTIAEIINTIKQIKQEREEANTNYVAIDTSKLTAEEYVKLVKKQITVKELIEKGKIYV